MSTQDDRENNILAAGGIFALLHPAGLEPEIVYDGRTATNAMIVRLHFMQSPYLITVERVADDDVENVPPLSTETPNGAPPARTVGVQSR